MRYTDAAVTRQRDQPRTAPELPFVGFPDPDLKREQGLVVAERRLDRIEAGEGRAPPGLAVGAPPRSGAAPPAPGAPAPRARCSVFRRSSLSIVGSMRRRWTGAMASRSERRLTTDGFVGSDAVTRAVEPIEQRPRAHALGDRERQVEVAFAANPAADVPRTSSSRGSTSRTAPRCCPHRPGGCAGFRSHRSPRASRGSLRAGTWSPN